MINKFLSWLVCSDISNRKNTDKFSVFILFLIFSYSLNVLFPNFNAANFQDLDLELSALSNSTGKLSNQLFWLFVFFISCYVVLKNVRPIKIVFSNQVYLALLLVLIFISFSWAISPLHSIKRSILFSIVLFSVFVGVSYIKNSSEIILVFYRVSGLALILNFLSLVVGNGFDLEGYFRGVHGHKNVLGPVAALSIFFGVAVRSVYFDLINRKVNFVFILCWFIFLLMSVSKTSIALFALVPVVLFFSTKISGYFKFSLGFFLLSVLFFFGLIISVVFLWSGLNFQEFLGLFMSDTSFTGRDFIWAFMLDEIQHQWLLGYGFGSFWGIGFESPNIRYGEGFLMLLNQAHNGYLDLVAKVGVVGLVLYFNVIRTFSHQSEHIKNKYSNIYYLCWAVMLFCLINNVTESSIIRGYNFLWVMQLAIISLIARLYSEKRA